MCSNDELKEILNEQVIPRLDTIEVEMRDQRQRTTRLEQLQELDNDRVTANQQNIMDINDKLDALPQLIASAIDQRNLFYVRSAGRRVIALVGAILIAFGGALGLELVRMFY